MSPPAPRSRASRVLDGLLLVLLVLPWLNPWAPAPSPAVMPVLVSWVCALAFWALAPWAGGRALGLVAWGWLVAGLISAGIGCLQYFGAAEPFAGWISRSEIGQAFGNLRQRNQLATLMNMALAALVGLVLAKSTPAGAVPRLGHAMALLAAALLAVGNAATSSRTGLLQLLLLACACLGWARWRQPAARQLVWGAVLVYVLAVFALPWALGLGLGENGVLERLRAGDSACGSRLTLWSNVLHLVAQKPWLGWGWGELDYAHYMTLYNGARFCEILDNAHNLPLHLAVELGVPAALLLCGGAVALVWRAQPWAATAPQPQMAWAVLAVLALHSLLEYPLWYGPFQLAVACCVALLWAHAPAPHTAWARRLRAIFTRNRPLARMIYALAATILIAFCALLAWNYQVARQIYLAPSARLPAYRDDTLAKTEHVLRFGPQVRFAALSLTTLRPDNARWVHDTAQALLHFSPEPRVVEKLIESAVMLGLDDEAKAHMLRFEAAYPDDYARWVQKNALPAAAR